MIFDVTIVGAGIVGLATAYQLSSRNPELKIAIVDKERKAAQHQTANNSGVIHSGIYYKPGGSKAINCRKGYEYLLNFCDEYEIPYKLCGKVIVASKEGEQASLEDIFQRGIANGLKGIQKISRAETLEREPHVHAVEAIWVPQAGIINYQQVAEKYLELVRANGAKFYPSQSLYRVIRKEDELRVITDKREIKTATLITCAGLYSDKVAALTGQKLDYQILPFRGEYYQLLPEKEYLVNGLIYPVPNPAFPFLGVHLTPRIQGGIEAGPNAVLALRREGYNRWQYHAKEFKETVRYPGFKALARKYWKTGLGEQHRAYSKKASVKALQTLIPSIRSADLVRGHAGVRAMAVRPNGEMIDDFLILEQERIINVCNAPSPAATASLAIGESVAEKALQQLEYFMR
ncbi:MAG: L-2-hydroxyglutarate oxidase [Bacteroidota bacterium]